MECAPIFALLLVLISCFVPTHPASSSGNCSQAVCRLKTVDLTTDGMKVLRGSVNSSWIHIEKLLVRSTSSGPVLLGLSQIAGSVEYAKYKDPVFQIPAGTEFTEITIYGRNLRSFVASGKNEWLVLVHLIETSLDRIPGTIGNLRTLQELTIHYSDIAGVDIGSFANNRDLQNVILEENKITQLFLSSRKDLILPITYLSLEGNRLEFVDMAALQPLQNLQFLVLNRNPITKIDSSTLVTLPALGRLYAALCNIKAINLSRVALPMLAKLTLHYNKLEAVPAQLGVQERLRWLTLTNNSIKQIDLAAFRLLPALEWIDIDNCEAERVYSSITPLLLPKLESLALFSNKLTRFNLSGCDLPSIRDISLSQNRLEMVPNLHMRYPKLYINMRINPIPCNALQPYRTTIANGLLVFDTMDEQKCQQGTFVYDDQGSAACCVANA